MKRLVLFLMVAVAAFAAGTLLVSRLQSARHAHELATQRAAWEAEKAGIESALASAQAGRAKPSPVIIHAAPPTGAPAALKPTPEELVSRLAAM